MNHSINLTEIFIVNSAGVICLLFLLYSRFTNKKRKRVGEPLLLALIGITFTCLIMEMIAYYIDGRSGTLYYVLQYVSNATLYAFGAALAYIWCLYVEFKNYYVLKRVYRIAKILALPMVVLWVLVLCDCFGAGLIFSISSDNVYQRSSLQWLYYLVLLFYSAFSIAEVYYAKYKGNQINFFPIYTFLLPIMLGVVVQVSTYGVVAMWFSVAIAHLFLEIQLEKEDSFVDELSGLYNRKYLEFCYSQMRSKNVSRVYGIMMDINLFKSINDTYGHTAGDDAIRTFSRLLSQWANISDTVIRFAGDEFIVLCFDKDEFEVEYMIRGIKKNLRAYNATRKKPYELSVSMGYAKYSDKKLDEFLHEMDEKMYADKEAFRREHPNLCRRGVRV